MTPRYLSLSITDSVTSQVVTAVVVTHNDSLVVLPEPHDEAAKEVLEHGNASAHGAELFEGYYTVPLHTFFEGPQTVEALAHTLGGGEDGTEPDCRARIFVDRTTRGQWP